MLLARARLVIVTLCALAYAAPVISAQSTSNKTSVAFDCTCKDGLSMQFQTRVRDLLAVSPRYKEVALSAKSPNNKSAAFEWKISVVTVVSDASDSDREITMSIVVTFDDVYMGQFVQVCGSDTLTVCANGVIADFDSAIHAAKP